jgi:hypothetical protein
MASKNISKHIARDDTETQNQKLSSPALQYAILPGFSSDQYTALLDEYQKLKIENAELKAKISINESERRISEDNHRKSEELLNKEIYNLKNEEIAKLNNLIAELKEEKKNLIEQLKLQTLRIEKLEESNKELIFSNKELTRIIKTEEAANEELKSASLISDLLAKLFQKFILKNKDDENFKHFIKINSDFEDPFIEKIELQNFHRFLKMPKTNEKAKEKANVIKSKFNTFTNYESYDDIQSIYKDICQPRNKNPKCHSNLNNTLDDDNDPNFLKDIETEIEKRTFYKNEALKILSILKKNE